MISETINGDKWKSITMRKLISFCDKSPILLKIRTCVNNGSDGVTLIHVNSGREYFFPWEYGEDPKKFIHNIKNTLKYKHYPILVEDIVEDYKYSMEELAQMVEEGKSVNDLPERTKKVVGRKYYLIDKVVMWKDVIILEETDSARSMIEKPKQYRFKYNGSIMYFLKKYRNGDFKTIEEASKEFFDNSIMVNEIIDLEKNNEN